MINIVIPMAGAGSRFANAGYADPKPFIDVCGKPMIVRVVENLIPYEAHRFIFLARRGHEKYIKKEMSFATNVIYIDEQTEGAACTVLLAKNLINCGDPLIIANSDQLVKWNNSLKTNIAIEHNSQYWRESNNIQDMINASRAKANKAMIATFKASHPKWSYVRIENGVAVEVAEKKVISENATVGVYYYEYGWAFVEAAEKMIKKNIRVNNEFYVCPVFNEMISNGDRVGIYEVEKMHGLGTPEDLTEYVRGF